VWEVTKKRAKKRYIKNLNHAEYQKRLEEIETIAKRYGDVIEKFEKFKKWLVTKANPYIKECEQTILELQKKREETENEHEEIKNILKEYAMGSREKYTSIEEPPADFLQLQAKERLEYLLEKIDILLWNTNGDLQWLTKDFLCVCNLATYIDIYYHINDIFLARWFGIAMYTKTKNFDPILLKKEIIEWLGIFHNELTKTSNKQIKNTIPNEILHWLFTNNKTKVNTFIDNVFNSWKIYSYINYKRILVFYEIIDTCKDWEWFMVEAARNILLFKDMNEWWEEEEKTYNLTKQEIDHIVKQSYEQVDLKSSSNITEDMPKVARRLRDTIDGYKKT